MNNTEVSNKYGMGEPALIEVLDKDYPIISLDDACNKWNQIRERTHILSSEMPHIAVLDLERNYLGHISYNGSFCSIEQEISYGIFRG